MKNIYEQLVLAAKPLLNGKAVKDLRVGISLTCVQLSDGSLGVAYVPRADLPNGCSIFSYIQEAVGRPAADIAQWASDGTDLLQHAVGEAVLCAASAGLDIPDEKRTDIPFDLDLNKGDTVGMVGFIPPLARQFSSLADRLILFDNGIKPGEITSLAVQPPEKQAELLPQCDIAVITGSAVANGTMDKLLAACKNARDIVIVGPSTPMLPAGWQGSGVTRLAGSFWDGSQTDSIFDIITKAGGIMHLRKYMIKKMACC